MSRIHSQAADTDNLRDLLRRFEQAWNSRDTAQLKILFCTEFWFLDTTGSLALLSTTENFEERVPILRGSPEAYGLLVIEQVFRLGERIAYTVVKWRTIVDDVEPLRNERRVLLWKQDPEPEGWRIWLLHHIKA